MSFQKRVVSQFELHRGPQSLHREPRRIFSAVLRVSQWLSVGRNCTGSIETDTLPKNEDGHEVSLCVTLCSRNLEHEGHKACTKDTRLQHKIPHLPCVFVSVTGTSCTLCSSQINYLAFSKFVNASRMKLNTPLL